MIGADLNGIWTLSWQDVFVLDDERAKQVGHVDERGNAGPHGTYIPKHLLRVQAYDEGKVENATILVYDADAAFCKFVWNEARHLWESSDAVHAFKLDALEVQTGGNDHPFKIPALGFDWYPTLTIAPYTASDSPHPLFVGNCRPKGLGDPGKKVAALPTQTLEYDGITGKLTWMVIPAVGESWNSSLPFMVLVRGVSPIERKESDPNGATFGQIFVAQSELDQVSSSFCGYNPGEIGGYGSSAFYAATITGTTPQNYPVDNPNQIFNGALLFAFPRYDSFDYFQATAFPGSPNLPVGIWPVRLDQEVEATHTALISTTRDEAEAFAVSFGLSAGIEKLLSISGSLELTGKNSKELTNESRTTVSRKVAKAWAAHLALPILPLHAQYIAAVKSRTLHLLSDTSPDESNSLPWDADFVPSYGTHYAQTITHGSIELAQTRLSLNTEVTAYEKGINLKLAGSATLEGATAGADTSLSQEWSSKYGITVSEEDVSHVAYGKPHSVGILMDLRPTSELLSPIFFPHDDKDEWGKFAPWVWTTVRKSFEKWLDENGLNQPIDVDAIRTYTPHRFDVANVTLHVSGQTASDPWNQPDGILKATGTIDFIDSAQVVKSDPPCPPSPQNVDTAQSLVSLSMKSTLLDVAVHPDAYAAPVSCAIYTTASNIASGADGGLCVLLEYDLKVTEAVKTGSQMPAVLGGQMFWTESTVQRAHFQNKVWVALPFEKFDGKQSKAPKTTITDKQGVYTLEITIAATDAGEFTDA